MNELRDLGVTLTARPVWAPPLASSFREQQPQALFSATTLGDMFDLSGETASWVIEAAKKLESLGRFRVGWNSYGGLPLAKGAKSLVLQVLTWLRKEELPVPGVVLGSGGNVQLEWRANGKELEIDLRDSNSIEFVKVSTGGEIEEGESSHNLPEKVRKLALWLVCA
jgi:hypothetical protein